MVKYRPASRRNAKIGMHKTLTDIKWFISAKKKKKERMLVSVHRITKIEKYETKQTQKIELHTYPNCDRAVKWYLEI